MIKFTYMFQLLFNLLNDPIHSLRNNQFTFMISITLEIYIYTIVIIEVEATQY